MTEHQVYTRERLRGIWSEIYGQEGVSALEELLNDIEKTGATLRLPVLEPDWHKDVVVYSLYVDLFSKDFKGLERRLEYFADIGISCLWLLPILESPMRDGGFDISDYRRIRQDLLGGADQETYFPAFIAKAHEKDIRIIFDIALNHTSEEHFWFREAQKSKDNPYRDFYIWSRDDKIYQDARVIFQGIESSNWRRSGDEYYFHRFFDFQPDLNYRNPAVLVEMCRNLLYWIDYGVDGFRADAIPYLWKEEGTSCENLEKTHQIVKFFRAVLDSVRPGTMLLAEACQKPAEVVRYFGDGDECHAGYHFPLMPQIFKSIAMGSALPVKNILSESVTPQIPESSQWFTFIRCHDELSLELVYVSEEDRAYIHSKYCHYPEWDFREGQGISARLAELFHRDPAKVCLAFSIMLTLPGTPVIYYGDEFGKLNDTEYYHEQKNLTGKDDSRFLVRGEIDWEEVGKTVNSEGSLESRIFSCVTAMIRNRNRFRCFGRGSLKWLTPKVSPCSAEEGILAFERSNGEETVFVLHNLTSRKVTVESENLPDISMGPFGYKWIVVK